jgi:MFS family permease
MKQQPTNVRREVLLLACSLSMITYLDRVCFGAAGTLIAKELKLEGVSALAGPFTAFAIAYGAFEIPSGWWGDVRGPRRVLLRIVLWWSLFTALTGLVGLRIAGLTLGGLFTLTVVRFLFGAGEAGAYPNIAKAIANWFPAHERGRAQGYVWMAGRLMGGLTPMVWMVLVHGTAKSQPLVSWRVAFLLFGAMGIAWCALFAWRFRDRPEEHPGVNDAERKLILSGRTHTESHNSVPWLALLARPSLLCLYAMYFCATYGWYFNITYLSDCLENRYGVKPTDFVGSLYKGGPLWLGAAGCVIGGYWTDRLLARGVSRRVARRLPGIVGHALCAGCYLAAAFMPDAFTFFLAISLAAFCNDLMMGSAWATCQDIGGRHTAVLAGFMNTVGSLGAAAGGWFSGVIVAHYTSLATSQAGLAPADLPAELKMAALVSGYTMNLLVYAAVYVVATVCWLGVDPERKFEQEQPERVDDTLTASSDTSAAVPAHP